MAVLIYKNISIYSIKYIMLTVGIVSTIVLCMKPKAQELVVYLLICGQTGFGDERLYQNCTDISISVFCETNHTVWTSIKVFVMCLDALEERCEVVIRITEIVQLDDFRTIRR